MESDEAGKLKEETTSRTRATFRAVWTEFYEWQQNHARETIRSLAGAAGSSQPAPSARASSPLGAEEAKLGTLLDVTDTEAVTVWDYANSTSIRVSFETVEVTSTLQSTALYESCAPISRNIFHGDDPSDMPFMPYADDPTFDHSAYNEEYDAFAWQTRQMDPDCESHSSFCPFGPCASFPCFEWKSS